RPGEGRGATRAGGGGAGRLRRLARVPRGPGPAAAAVPARRLGRRGRAPAPRGTAGDDRGVGTAASHGLGPRLAWPGLARRRPARAAPRRRTRLPAPVCAGRTARRPVRRRLCGAVAAATLGG